MSSFERIGRLAINTNSTSRPGVVLSVRESEFGTFYSIMFDTGIEVLDEAQIIFLEEEGHDE